MALLYVDETKASLDRAPVDSSQTIAEGEFIVKQSDGTVARFDPANDDTAHGIVVHHPEGDSIVEHDEDYVDYDNLWEYDGSEGDRLYYQPLAEVDTIRPPSIKDTSEPAPSFSDHTEVGIVNISGETEIVEAGYTDSGGTQYGNGGAGDYVSLGRVEQYPQELRISDGYEQRIPVSLDRDLF